MRKLIFIAIAVIALLLQLLNPVWLTYAFVSIIGLVTTSSKMVSGIILVYAVIAFLVSIGSFFSIRGMKSEEIYNKKKNIIFLIINILTIILSVILLVLWRMGIISIVLDF